jgi:DNA-binding transcriptional MocR family regulator
MVPAEAPVVFVRRIEQLLTILTRQALRVSISAALEDQTARRLYELTGLKTSREIAQQLDLSPSTVSAYWTRWEALGLVVKEGQRYRKTFDDFAREDGVRRASPTVRKTGKNSETADSVRAEVPVRAVASEPAGDHADGGRGLHE